MNPILTVTRRFEFCYAHHLEAYDGKCRQIHGHNAVLEIEVGGFYKPENYDNGYEAVIQHKKIARIGDFIPTENYPGMVIDFGILKGFVHEIIEGIDHRNLNDVLGSIDCKYLPATCENLARYIWDRINEYFSDFSKGIQASYTNLSLQRIRIYETPNCWAEIRR